MTRIGRVRHAGAWVTVRDDSLLLAPVAPSKVVAAARARRIFVGLGSNLGDREEALCRTVEALAEVPGVRVLRRSSLYDSAPLGPAQPRFLNAAVEVETTLEPAGLFLVAKGIESRLGRSAGERWGPREIDIDLLIGDDEVQTNDLSIPHPRLGEREFALRPVAELESGLVHPGAGKTLAKLLAALPPQDVRRVVPGGRWRSPGAPGDFSPSSSEGRP